MLKPSEIARHAPFLEGLNILINGSMRVSQRGNYTAEAAAVNGYHLDRWYNETSGVTSPTFQHGVDGERQTLKLKSGGVATNRLNSYQKIEFPERLHGKTIQIQADVKSNHPDARILVYTGATHGFLTFTDAVHTGGGAFEQLTTEVTLPSANVDDLRIYVGLREQDGSNVSLALDDYIEFTDVKVEVGETPTYYSERSYGEELALCQRYYWESVGSVYMLNRLNTDTHRTAEQPFPVTMRTTPTVTYTASAGAGTVSTQVTVDLVRFNTNNATAAGTQTIGDITADAEL